ncbi:MAG TPA: hypothetical protein VIU12_18610 [Chryseolinea sp.]
MKRYFTIWLIGLISVFATLEVAAQKQGSRDKPTQDGKSSYNSKTPKKDSHTSQKDSNTSKKNSNTSKKKDGTTSKDNHSSKSNHSSKDNHNSKDDHNSKDNHSPKDNHTSCAIHPDCDGRHTCSTHPNCDGHHGQPGQHPSCDNDSYSTVIVKQEPISETCTEYEVKVSYNGTRTFGLSHYSMSIPCGELKDVSNSEQWKQVFGKDPTTGVYGLKIDNISGFGEGRPDDFTIKFTWCSDNSCNKTLGIVAYKYGQCVDYDTLSHPVPPGDTTQTCSTLLASLQKTNVTCSTSADGQVEATIQDGQAPFTYAWSTGATTPAIQNLSAGVYSVTITDANGNTLTLHETVSAPAPIVITESVSNPSCSGVANGSITLDVTGGTGTGTYTYFWSNGSSQQNLANAPSGLYTVTVTDSTNCTAQKSFMLTNSSLLSATALLINPSCSQANGSIDVTPSGGVTPFTYLWSNGATTQDVNGLGAGTFTVKITDALGCSTSKSYTLKVNNTLLLTYVVTPTSCVGDTFGAIDLSIVGGTSPYVIKWADGPTTEDRTGLAVGIYTVTVADAAGCSTQAAISVFQKPLTVASEINQPVCATDLGSITLTVSGVPPYTYTWSNGATGSAITGLPAGFYTVVVADASGCSRTLSFLILSPTALEVTGAVSNAQCGVEGSYGIDLSVMGGKPLYTYLWSTGATTQNVTGLNSGTYSVTVKDAAGCTATREFTVDPVSVGWSCIITPPTKQVVCGSAGNSISTAVAGATDYLWTVTSTDNSWTITSGHDSTAVYTAGSSGSSATFTLTITKNGCTQTCSYTTSSTCIQKDNTGGGDPSSSDPCTTTVTTVQQQAATEVPVASATKIAFELNVYPNPFKDKLNFEWTAPYDDYVQVEILDKSGRRLTTVFEGKVTKGQHYNFEWSAAGLTDHFYFYKYSSSRNKDYGQLTRKR